MDRLSLALADAERMHVAATKAVGSAPATTLASSTQRMGLDYNHLNSGEEQYRHFRGWSFVAIRAVASKIAGQDVCVGKVPSSPRRGRKSTGDSLEPLDSHPFLDALQNPNPLQVRWSLVYSTVASLLLTGRSYWWTPTIGGRMQLWPIPSHWMRPGDPLRETWMLRPFREAEEHTLPGSEVVPFLMPDPSDPFGSVSPLQSQAHAVSTDEEIQNAQFRAFQNGIFPGLMVRVGKLPGMLPDDPASKPVLTSDQRNEITEALLSTHHSGRRNAPLIVDGLIEGVEKLTNTVEEMDFLDSGKQTKARIMQAFGVNPIVTGETENANKAQAVVAMQQFCDSVNPIVELMSQSITRWLQHTSPGHAAWIEPCKADDPEQRLAEWRAARAVGDVSTNEFRAHVLNLPGVPGGDVLRDSLGNEIGETDKGLNGHDRLQDFSNGHGPLQDFSGIHAG